MIKFEKAVNEHIEKILQDYYDKPKLSLDILSATAYLDGLKLNSKMRVLIPESCTKT
jgi:hypothetical protein